MADVVEATVVLVCPVQNRLAQRHDGGTEADEGGPGAGPPADDLVAGGRGALAGKVPSAEVPEVEEGLDGVEEALGAGEAVAGAEGLEAVDVVDLAVELVGGPEGVVPGAAGHGVGAEEDVAGVPDDEGEGDCEPEEGCR